MEGCQCGGGEGGEWGKGTGNKKLQNSQGEVKNSMRNGEAKELIYRIHGHELRWGNAGGRGVQGTRE